jgi:arabinose-5-phosphate isomerase
MLTAAEMIKYAQQVLDDESNAIKALIPNVDRQFVHAVELIVACKGRIIVTGMGKPGYIAHKLAATLMSTGTPSIYLHPAEAIHGDLGMITPNDVMIAISNSGETAEIVHILPTIRNIGAPLIAVCGNSSSTLAKNADCFLDAHVTKEACPLDLAPTTSTTVQLALSDALAVVVMTVKGFTSDDFAFYHPGGNLGQHRLLTAGQLIAQTEKNPCIGPDRLISEALFSMTAAGVGAVSVVDGERRLLGIITDGDIRRQLEKEPRLLDLRVEDIMTANPMTISERRFASEALALMESHQPAPITVLPVLDDDKHVIGMIHLTDLIRFKASR